MVKYRVDITYEAPRYRDNYLSRSGDSMSRKFDDFLNGQLNDAEIRSEYEALQPEHDLIQAMIDNVQEVHKVISAKQKI